VFDHGKPFQPGVNVSGARPGAWPQDTVHDDNRLNDIQNNDIQPTISIITECCYAECLLCRVLFMLTVENKLCMQSVMVIAAYPRVEHSVRIRPYSQTLD
jgi:hypothetical protein